MSLAQTSASNLHDLAAYRTREYRMLVQELRQARATLASGPEILALVNEIVLVSEELLDVRSVAGSDEPGRSCCPDGDRFLSALTEAAEQARVSNGQIGRAFLDLLEAIPILADRRAA